MKWQTLKLGSIYAANRQSVDPAASPEELFHLYSVAAYDSKTPEELHGSSIGSVKQLVSPNDVLLCRIVPHIRRAWIVGDHSGHRLIGSGEWIALRHEKVHAGYLRHFLLSDQFHSQFMMSVAGVGGSLLRARPGAAAEIEVPLPPLEEQQRIAAILDKADILRQRRRAALEKLDSLTKSLFLDMFGHPATNPKGLEEVTLGEVAQFVGGGTPSRGVEAFFSGSICWATSKDMKGEFLRDTQEHITEEAVRRSATKLVPAGAVLVVVKSKVLLHRLPVLINCVPTCFGQDLKAIILANQWPARYVARHLRVDQQRLLDRARGINTEGLTLEHLREYKLLKPTWKDLMRYDSLEKRIEIQRQTALEMLRLFEDQFASLRDRAFRGEL